RDGRALRPTDQPAPAPARAATGPRRDHPAALGGGRHRGDGLAGGDRPPSRLAPDRLVTPTFTLRRRVFGIGSVATEPRRPRSRSLAIRTDRLGCTGRLMEQYGTTWCPRHRPCGAARR